jgi:hypothetical protein
MSDHQERPCLYITKIDFENKTVTFDTAPPEGIDRPPIEVSADRPILAGDRITLVPSGEELKFGMSMTFTPPEPASNPAAAADEKASS